MKKILPILLLIIQVHFSIAQMPDWINTYLTQNSLVRQMETLNGPNRSVYVSAQIGNYNNKELSTDNVFKYSDKGTLEWMRSTENVVLQSNSGNIAMNKIGEVVQCGVLDTSINNVYIKKYDANGNLLWEKSLGLVNDNARSTQLLINDSNQIFLLACWSGVFTLTKFDASGNIYWTTKDSSLDAAFNIDYDGNSVVYKQNYFNNGIIKYDVNGQKKWAKKFGNYQDFYNYYFIQSDKLNNIYLLTNPTNQIGSSILLTKLDPDGNELWHKEYFQNEEFNYTGGFILDDQANSYIAGSLHPNCGYKDSIFLMKSDSSGALLHLNYYSGTKTFDDLHSGMYMDSMKQIYIFGQANSYSGRSESLILKWDSACELKGFEQQSFMNSKGETIYSLSVTSSGEMVCSGVVQDSLQNGIYTIGFSKLTGIPSLNVPHFNLQIYPNPATQEIAFNAPKGVTFNKAMIYDALGKLVLEGTISSTSTFDIGSLSIGIYQCIGRDQNGQVYSNKLVVMH